ncbi:MAG: TIGR03560 family F420-dependent LLM class oxidoreductase [Acidimicrobiales bacterium]
MRFSFWVGNSHPWPFTLDACRHAEASGWDGIYIADHFMPNAPAPDGAVHEAWTMLAALAAAVPRVRLGPLVAGNTYRNPALVAKIVATLDHVSGGRAVLGLGAGWQVNEHEAYGFELGTVRSRLDRLEEACAIVSSLLTAERTTFEGAYYRVADAPLTPRPVQAKIPLLVGGGGEKRTLRLAARYADEWNIWGTPELLAQKQQVLDRWCEAEGRDPGAIQRSAVALLYLSADQELLAKLRGRQVERPRIIGDVDEVRHIIGAYQAAGVHEIVIPDFSFRSAEERDDTLDQFITEAAAEFR